MAKKTLLSLIVISVLVGWWNYEPTPFLGATEGVLNCPPIQTPTDIGPFDFSDYSFFPHTYRITPVARYDLKGRVLHKRRYISDKYHGDLVAYDLGIGWGAMSDPYILHNFFEFDHKSDSGGGRFLWMNFKTDEKGAVKAPPQNTADPMTQLSNNHIIPANKKVFRQLAELKAGDLVELTGYLVNVADVSNPGWSWQTSTTRTDTSTHWGTNNTSCETIFVTGVERILSTNPLVKEQAPEWFWPR